MRLLQTAQRAGRFLFVLGWCALIVFVGVPLAVAATLVMIFVSAPLALIEIARKHSRARATVDTEPLPMPAIVPNPSPLVIDWTQYACGAPFDFACEKCRANVEAELLALKRDHATYSAILRLLVGWDQRATGRRQNMTALWLIVEAAANAVGRK